MLSKPKLILIGGGGHCRSCIDVIEKENKYSIAGILDEPEKVEQKIFGYPIIGSDDQIPILAKEDFFFLITIGQIKTANVRLSIYKKLKECHALLPVIISPYAVVSDHSEIEEGTIIMHNAVVNAGAFVGKNCIINSKALIEHDARVGDHTHISTGAIVNGDCSVGSSCFVGSGAVLHQGIKISQEVIIGAGAIVSKNIQESGVYVGSPAKKIK